MDKETIYNKAKQRIAEIFKIAEFELGGEVCFDSDLRASVVSDFQYNAFDQILHDIQDVASGAIAKEIAKGELVIETVDDYCEYMVRCFELNPKEVMYILNMP